MEKHTRNNLFLFIFLASDFKVTENDSLIDWTDVWTEIDLHLYNKIDFSVDCLYLVYLKTHASKF